eukprot:IDg12397t1
MNVTNSLTLTMADAAREGAHKLATGEIIDMFGGAWDGPEAWAGMKITRSKRIANVVEYFPVCKYPQGLDYNLCEFYAPSGFLPGGISIPLYAARTYEWRFRVLCRTQHLCNGADYDREITARA